MKRRTVICAALLLAWTMMSDAALSVNATYSGTITSDTIKEMEQQINDAKKEKDDLQDSVSDLKELKKELEQQKSNLKSYVAKLDQSVSEMEQNISNLKTQIVNKEAEIVQTQAELEAAEETARQQYDSMRKRIRIMYESDLTTSVWKIFAESDSFGSFLKMADYINSIYAYDQKMLEEYQLNCEYINLCKKQLELEKEILDTQKKSVEQEQAQVEALIVQKNKQITSYESDISNKEQAIKEYEQEIAEQNEIIAQLEKAVEEEKEKIKQQNTYDGGTFAFPLATYTRVSDDYGYRIHPILGVQQFHNGVDFAAPKGTAIYAAYDGTVIASASSATMGNYVMIDHGGGLYTIYMHASKLIASKGDTVAKGDTIAEVGSTGRSTGNHLHFSVRLNGSYVSPWNYISK